LTGPRGGLGPRALVAGCARLRPSPPATVADPALAGQLRVTAGDNPDRLRSEAAFAHLCGTAPIPASSGRTDRHRLHRGGDRAANTALYTVVFNRLRCDPDTRSYAARRTAQGLTKKEIIRLPQALRRPPDLPRDHDRPGQPSSRHTTPSRRLTMHRSIHVHHPRAFLNG
jgi:hypothetical protein